MSDTAKNKRPMFYWGWFTLLIAGVIWLLSYLFVTPPSNQQDASALPWHATLDETGALNVLGLTLNKSTTRDAMQLYGNEVEIVLFSNSHNEPVSLEAFYDDMRIGYAFRGRLVLTLDLHQDELREMQLRGGKVKSLNSGDREVTLSGYDLNAATNLPIKHLTYIPYPKIDEDVIQHRFGLPTKDYVGEDKLRRWVYPEKKLTVIFDDTGRKVLEFGHNNL